MMNFPSVREKVLDSLFPGDLDGSKNIYPDVLVVICNIVEVGEVGTTTIT